MSILVVGALDPAGPARLRAAGHETLELAALDAPGAAAALRDARALVVGEGQRVTEAVLRAAPALVLVVRVGTGLEGVDLAAARERGVRVADTSGASAIAVAEHVFALLLALERRLLAADALVRRGGWDQVLPAGRELAGRTLGLVGFGRVGREVAWRGRAFGMEVRWCDPLLDLAPAGYEWARRTTLEQLLPEADVLSLHVPLTHATRGLIGARELARLRPDAVLVQTARGGVVDELALRDALAGGRLRGAALDVFATEPPVADPLLALTNVVVTPHVAGVTTEARRRASLEAATLVLEALGRR
jgi:phosphoglycerate dehydrogenase-like enzyme